MANFIQNFTFNIYFFIEFFKSIVSTNVWAGKEAKRYKEIVNNEKQIYLGFGDAFQKFLETSKSSMEDLETCIKKNTLE